VQSIAREQFRGLCEDIFRIKDKGSGHSLDIKENTERAERGRRRTLVVVCINPTFNMKVRAAQSELKSGQPAAV
jgi:hypothetical protein